MADNPKKTGEPDRSLVAIGQAHEVAYWTKRFGVSEAKLNALPSDKLTELRDNGALQQIYAHLISLVGWDRLIALAMARQAQALPVAANA